MEKCKLLYWNCCGHYFVMLRANQQEKNDCICNCFFVDNRSNVYGTFEKIEKWLFWDARLILLNVFFISVAYIEAIIKQINRKKLQSTKNDTMWLFLKNRYIFCTALVFWILATCGVNHTHHPGYSLILLVLIGTSPINKNDKKLIAKAMCIGVTLGLAIIQ